MSGRNGMSIVCSNGCPTYGHKTFGHTTYGHKTFGHTICGNKTFGQWSYDIWSHNAEHDIWSQDLFEHRNHKQNKQ